MKKPLLITLLLTLAFTTYAQVTNGLVAKYSFNSGNANDEAGTNNGTVSNAVLSTDRFGNSNKAYYFNGTNSSINLGASATVKPTIGSISVWVSVDTTSTAGKGYSMNPIIIAKNDITGSSYFEGYALYYNYSTNRFAAGGTESGTSNEKFIVSSTVLQDTWFHLVYTYDNDSSHFYLNGFKAANSINKGFASTFISTKKVMMGYSDDATNERYFHGAIDDVGIYNRVLTPAEVTTLYNEPNPSPTGLTVGNQVSQFVYPNPTNGVVHFQMGRSAVVYDLYGKIIASEVETDKIDFSELPAGPYYLHLQNNLKSTTEVFKIFKY